MPKSSGAPIRAARLPDRMTGSLQKWSFRLTPYKCSKTLKLSYSVLIKENPVAQLLEVPA